MASTLHACFKYRGKVTLTLPKHASHSFGREHAQSIFFNREQHLCGSWPLAYLVYLPKEGS